jgi:hypothetical protein
VYYFTNILIVYRNNMRLSRGNFDGIKSSKWVSDPRVSVGGGNCKTRRSQTAWEQKKDSDLRSTMSEKNAPGVILGGEDCGMSIF